MHRSVRDFVAAFSDLCERDVHVCYAVPRQVKAWFEMCVCGAVVIEGLKRWASCEWGVGIGVGGGVITVQWRLATPSNVTACRFFKRQLKLVTSHHLYPGVSTRTYLCRGDAVWISHLSRAGCFGCFLGEQELAVKDRGQIQSTVEFFHFYLSIFIFMRSLDWLELRQNNKKGHKYIPVWNIAPISHIDWCYCFFSHWE